MPTYQYVCNSCLSALTGGKEPSEEQHYSCLFDTYYSFSATKEEIAAACICPRCNGTDVDRNYTPVMAIRIKGKNAAEWRQFYKDNAAAIQADKNLHDLQHSDPYKDHRTPGEVKEVADKIRDSTKKKKDTKYFT